MSGDLAEFLLACIAEDKAAAEAATPSPWRWVDPRWGRHPVGRVKQALVGDRDQMILPSHSGDMWPSASDADQITRWNPARVLAECEAKRQIVELYQRYEASIRQEFAIAKLDDPISDTLYAARDALTEALRLLALPFADRPGYREEWRP
jgi:hypothetical protein